MKNKIITTISIILIISLIFIFYYQQKKHNCFNGRNETCYNMFNPETGNKINK